MIGIQQFMNGIIIGIIIGMISISHQFIELLDILVGEYLQNYPPIWMEKIKSTTAHFLAEERSSISDSDNSFPRRSEYSTRPDLVVPSTKLLVTHAFARIHPWPNTLC